MPEELDRGCVGDACWGQGLWLGLGGWAAPLGGLVVRGSSSEELSSDAPRMNLSRSLPSGPELSIGACVFKGFCGAGGKDDFSEFTSGDTCRASVSAVLTSRPPEALLVWGLLLSFCAEVERDEDKACSSGWGDCKSSLAAGGWPPDGDSSPFTGIAAVLVLILHSSNSVHRINTKTPNMIIHRHPPEAATTEDRMHYNSCRTIYQNRTNLCIIRSILILLTPHNNSFWCIKLSID